MSRSTTLLVKRPLVAKQRNSCFREQMETTVLPSERTQETEAAGYDSVQGSMGEATAWYLPERDIRLLLMT